MNRRPKEPEQTLLKELFQRGPSRIQPPEAMVGFRRFISQHTLEIYAIQLAGSELLIKLVPDLAA